MFEILRALIEVQQACLAHDTSLRWDITEVDGELAIRAEIPITNEDQHFAEGMRALLGPT